LLLTIGEDPKNPFKSVSQLFEYPLFSFVHGLPIDLIHDFIRGVQQHFLAAVLTDKEPQVKHKPYNYLILQERTTIPRIHTESSPAGEVGGEVGVIDSIHCLAAVPS